jgi:hypothetical protein
LIHFPGRPDRLQCSERHERYEGMMIYERYEGNMYDVHDVKTWVVAVR